MALSRKGRVVDDRDLYPADDGVPMEDLKHAENGFLLVETLRTWLAGAPAFAAVNNFIYYLHGDRKKCVGPDFYVVLGAPPDPDRDCWRVWNEDGLLPQVIVEFLSKSSVKKDRVTNFAIYRDTLRTRNYFICDNRRMRLDGYVLEGDTYVPLLPDARGRFFCHALGLWVGFHEGWLRWFRPDGSLVPTKAEAGDEASRRAASETQRADHEAQRAEREAQRVEQEARRADDAVRLRDEALAEVERLKRLLEERRDGD